MHGGRGSPVVFIQGGAHPSMGGGNKLETHGGPASGVLRRTSPGYGRTEKPRAATRSRNSRASSSGTSRPGPSLGRIVGASWVGWCAFEGGRRAAEPLRASRTGQHARPGPRRKSARPRWAYGLVTNPRVGEAYESSRASAAGVAELIAGWPPVGKSTLATYHQSFARMGDAYYDGPPELRQLHDEFRNESADGAVRWSPA